MKHVFISHKHTDNKYILDLKSALKNPNNKLHFEDLSLREPVLNDYGDINRRSPNDLSAKPVRDKIEALLKQSQKLIVIIGRDTHSSLWVQWEIDTFKKYHGERGVYLMHTPNGIGGAPSNTSHLTIHQWDLGTVANWVNV